MSAPRTLPALLAPLIAARQGQLQQLQAEIAALQAAAPLDASQPTPDVVLCLYLGLGSAKAVARHCNAQGWRLPGATGNTRQWAPNDVYAEVRVGRPADARLKAMALAQLQPPAGRPFAAWT